MIKYSMFQTMCKIEIIIVVVALVILLTINIKILYRLIL